jgi:hypothetical protein
MADYIQTLLENSKIERGQWVSDYHTITGRGKLMSEKQSMG